MPIRQTPFVKDYVYHIYNSFAENPVLSKRGCGSVKLDTSTDCRLASRDFSSSLLNLRKNLPAGRQELQTFSPEKFIIAELREGIFS